MTEFTIQAAGVPVGVTAMFSSTRDYCRAYFTDREPAFSVSTCREDLVFEQNAAREEAIMEGFRFRQFSDPYLERAAIHRKIGEHLFDYDTLVFHGSAVAVDGQGYLFTAKSGTGKSTHTRFWRETFGSRAVMVNDDKPFLRFTEAGVLICGSPWSGKHGLDANITVPLKGLCILQRGMENHIRRICPEEAMEMLLKQSIRPLDPEKLPKYQTLVKRLAAETPLWQMACTRERMAAEVAWGAMSK
ncbi:MAG: hypothetical protein J6J12_09450 [Oscillospiraceae bacterium]|nr:hypothetical protein [Oscillospiraceae bacterium]